MTTPAPEMVAAVRHYVARCVRQADGCLVNERLAVGHYGEVRWADRRTTAHRAALAVHVGDLPDGDVVARHACDNSRCCDVAHLSFGSQAENVGDIYDRGRRSGGWRSGEDLPHILTADDVRAMRQLAADGVSLGDIVARFGYPYSPTRMAIRGETWKSIKDVPPVAGRVNSRPNPHAYRLTKMDQAKEVRRLISGGLSLAEVASHLGISRTTAWSLSQVTAGEVA